MSVFFLSTSSNSLHKKKNITFNQKRIFSIQKQNNLCFTYSYFDEAISTIHAYLYDNNIAVLLHTFHINNKINDNLRSYINKLHHWNDLLLFKEKKLSVYDFGGIDENKYPGISNFKLSFGGKKVKYYNCIKKSGITGLLVNIIK